jgi:hypothetical protein
MGGSAVEIALSSNASEDMRTAAAQYVRKVHYTEGFDKIVQLASSVTEGNLKREALVTSAVLRPTDRLLLAESQKLISQTSPRSIALRTAVEIVMEVSRSRYDSEGEAERTDVGKKLLNFAFAHGVYVAVGDDPRLRFRIPDEDGASVRPQPRIVIWIPTGAGSASGLTVGVLSQLNALKPYWSLLQDAANENNLEKIKKLLLREGDFSTLAMGAAPAMLAIRITIPREAAVIVQDESKQERKLTDNLNAFLVPMNRNDVTVSWTEADKRELNGTLVAFSGKGFEFSGRQISRAPPVQ